jgi:hypothetical protein
MPIRLGKATRVVLKRMATNQLQGIRANSLTNGWTSRERKVIRQLIKMHEQENWPMPNLTIGPKRTPLRPLTPEQVEAYKRMRLAGSGPKFEPMTNIATLAAIKEAKSPNLSEVSPDEL